MNIVSLNYLSQLTIIGIMGDNKIIKLNFLLFERSF